MIDNVNYILKKSSRTRSLRISVYPDGRCIVSAPTYLGQGAIDTFVNAKSKWIMDKLRGFMPFRPMAKRKNTRAEFLKHKEAARKLVMERIPILNQAYGFKVGRIAIRNQKSRWGSCSARGNLNFNYKLALLPQELCDYVIVHELCHLREFNHSYKFWDLVAKTFPNYQELRRGLKSRARDL